MSSNVLDRPRVDEEWIVLNDAPLSFYEEVATSVVMRGHGDERHGVLASGGVRAAPATLVGLPSVDDLD